MDFKKLKPLGLIGIFVTGTVLGAAGLVMIQSVISSAADGSNPEIASHSGLPESDANEPSGLIDNEHRSLGTEDALSRLEDIAQVSSTFARNAELHRLVDSADQKTLLSMLSLSSQIKPSTVQPELQKPIVQRLAMMDPRRALSAVEKLPHHQNDLLTKEIFHEWSQSSLDEAVKFAKQMKNDSIQFTALRGILESRSDLSDDVRRGIARELGNESIAEHTFAQEAMMGQLENPEKAWYSMVDDWDGDLQSSGYLLHVANAWVNQSGLGVLDEIYESLDDRNSKMVVLSGVIASAMQRDPEATFNRTLMMESEQASTLALTAARTWARSDPQSAFSAASNVSKGGLRLNLQRTIISSWASNNPSELLAAVSTFPENLTKYAEMKAVTGISRESPEEAAQLMATMDFGEDLSSVARTIANNWSRKDPLAAVEWVLTNADLENQRRSLLRPLLGKLAREQPEMAMDIALQQPVEFGLEAGVISRLASVDVHKALTLLSRVRQGAHQFPAYTSVGSALVDVGQTQRAMKLANELPEELRDVYYRSVFGKWARSDPEGLLAEIDKLSSASLKSSAAFALASNSRFGQSLSDEQMEYAKSFLNEKELEMLDRTRSTFHSFDSVVLEGGISASPDVEIRVESVLSEVAGALGDALQQVEVRRFDVEDLVIDENVTVEVIKGP